MALNSTCSNRSLAAWRTHSTFWAMAAEERSWRSSEMVPSGSALGRMPTMSASRPAMLSMRLLPAPIRIGGWGRWAGIGKLWSSVTE